MPEFEVEEQCPGWIGVYRRARTWRHATTLLTTVQLAGGYRETYESVGAITFPLLTLLAVDPLPESGPTNCSPMISLISQGTRLRLRS